MPLVDFAHIEQAAQLIRMMNSRVEDYTVRGKCSNCGQCCSDFHALSDEEFDEISTYIVKHKIKEQRKAGPFSSHVLDQTCPFRDEAAGRCTIYPVRPLQCRMFLCNRPYHVLMQQKKKLYNGRTSVSFRHQFFQNTSNMEFLLTLNQQLLDKMTGGVQGGI